MPALTSTATDTPQPTETSTRAPTLVPQLPFVRVNGLGFTVENRPFRFIGANAPYFGYYREYGLSIEDAIKSARENDIRVLRISLTFSESRWDYDSFEEYDKVLDIAARRGLYVIANLAEGCCRSNNGSETREAYLARFPHMDMTSDSALAAFKDHIRSVLMRRNTVNGRIYRDDPTIMAWDIANEPALELFSDAEFGAWLDKVTTYIKTIDHDHLLTIGLNTSPGIYSTPGGHYQALNVPDLDYFSFHYNTIYTHEIASQLASIGYRAEVLRAMGKPVVMEEFGAGSQRIFPQDVSAGTLDEWLQSYKAQLDTAFSAGASGALFWGWGVPETKKVLLWWRQEDHDSSETEFTALIRNYEIQPARPAPDPAATIATPQPTQAFPPDTYVYASCTLSGQEKQARVAYGMPIVILWGWKANTAAQLQDYFDNHVTTVTLDGRNISDTAPFGIASNLPGNYKLLWFVQLGTSLSPGTHKIVFDESWKKTITDGTDLYGPGSQHPTQHDECDIVIQ